MAMRFDGKCWWQTDAQGNWVKTRCYGDSTSNADSGSGNPLWWAGDYAWPWPDSGAGGLNTPPTKSSGLSLLSIGLLLGAAGFGYLALR